MTTYFSKGSPNTVIHSEELGEIISQVFSDLGERKNVLALPPDFTRFPSRAGEITCLLHDHYGKSISDIMPALGTHFAMPDWQLDKMFPNVPKELFRVHDWRNDVVTIGEVSAEFVEQMTEGIWKKPWKAQLNKLLWSKQHDLIVSIGQVVPHEVIGMANYNKNIFVGTGGEMESTKAISLARHTEWNASWAARTTRYEASSTMHKSNFAKTYHCCLC